MPNTAVSETIAQALTTGLIHPNNPDSPLMLPGLRTTGLPDDMKNQVQRTAGLIAEAIINLIENQLACTIIPSTELNQLRTTAATNNTKPAPTITINCQHGELLTITTRNNPTINCHQLTAHLDQTN